MPEYFHQDLSNPRGYAVVQGRPKPGEAAVALTKDGHCVFGSPGSGRATYAKAGSPLMHYDDEVERQRRLVCDTALGQLILDHPRVALPAVNMVSRGLEAYWRQLKLRLSRDGFKSIVETDGKYISNPTSFGRLPVAQPSSTETNQFGAKVDIWLGALGRADLPQILTVHDTFLKVYCANEKGAGKPTEAAARMGFREDWYDKTARGRANVPAESVRMSALPGLITSDFTIPFGPSFDRCGIDFATMRTEMRKRGTDMFMIDAQVMRPEFRAVLGQHNLVFAASASGTTSTLLASACTFSPGIRGNAEHMKQYLMACLAYLVGGGMHTSHEVFYTGGLAGLPYVTGKYLGMLPSTFSSSRYSERWQSEFWELVRPDRPTPR